MKYNILGNTSLSVSEICLGTMTFGEQNTKEEGFEQLDYALENGINFIDTAEMYAVPPREETTGDTERIIGEWINERNNRSQFILATKITGPSRNLEYISSDLRFTRNRIFEAIENSLKRLHTDYIDLYQLHWPERRTNCFGVRGYQFEKDNQWKDNFAVTIDTLNVLIKQGKIRHWGLSNETPWGVMHAKFVADQYEKQGPVSIQNPYNLLNRTFEIGNAEVSMREAIGLLAYSPVAFGRLTEKFHNNTHSPNDRINKYSRMSRYNGDNSLTASSKYYKLAQDYGLKLSQMAISFIRQRPFVASTIIGATNMQQLQENIDSISVDLSPEIINKIEAIHESIPNPAP